MGFSRMPLSLAAIASLGVAAARSTAALASIGDTIDGLSLSSAPPKPKKPKRNASGKPKSTHARLVRVSFGSIALINRWTGQPHEHKREIARRLRQEARRG